MPDQFTDTFLHDPANYNNPNLTYSTYWVTTLNAQGDFQDTFLNDVANYNNPNLTYATDWRVTL